MARFRVGTSGWHYNDWKSIFYPPGQPRSQWLRTYAGTFDTVELNASFYRLPTEKAFAGWRDGTPEHFLFAVKVSRFITHIKRLAECERPLTNFMERARALGGKLGPLLYQLPPGFHKDEQRLEAFLQLLPRGLQHVFEFRHASWLDEDVFAILRRYGAGLCVFDMAELTCPVIATADFAYIRFHGPSDLYSSSYSEGDLAAWAERIRALAQGLKTVYVYFNNDVSGYAIDNALSIRDILHA